MSQSTLNARVAAEIRAEMARQRLTGRRVGVKIGKPDATVSRWTTGATPLTLDQLELLADAIDVNASELVRRAFTGSSPDGGGDTPTVP